MNKKQTFWSKFKPKYFIWLGFLWGLISMVATLLLIFEIFPLDDYLPAFLNPIIGLSFFVFFLLNDGFNGLAMTEPASVIKMVFIYIAVPTVFGLFLSKRKTKWAVITSICVYLFLDRGLNILILLAAGAF